MKRTLLAVAVTAAILAGSATPVMPVAPQKSVLAVNALANGDAELLIYGFIGDYFFSESNTANDIVQRLAEINAGTIQVRINSQGGSVPDGLAIYNALKRHPARIVMTVDGQAMSIASLIVQAGDERIMGEGTVMMVHAPSADVGGNAVQLRQYADMLDTWAKSMLAIYTARVPKQADALSTMVNDGQDHYFTAAEAVDFGLADTLQNADAEEPDEAAAAAALLGYLDAISHAAGHRAPVQAVACLRRHIQNAAQPHLFASLPEATQRAVYAHIEDPTMRQKCLQIMAAAAGAQPAPAPTQPAPATTPAAPAAAGAPAPVASAPATAPAAQTAADVHAALRTRNAEIKAVLEPYMKRKGIDALYIESLADPAATIDSVRAKALELVGRESTPSSAGHVEAGTDESEKFRDGIGSALLIRAGLAKNDSANPFRGYALREIARACLERSGRTTRGMDIREVVAAGFTSTSDFPLLLANTARVALLKGFEEAPETYPQFTRPGTLSDFKEVSRAGLGVFSDLDEVPEGGEYKYGTFGEYGQKVKLATYGKLFAITRQAVINDDLGAFTDVPRKMGRASKRTIGTLVFDVLTSNPNMSDGVALFHATHKNLLTGAAISTTSIDAMDAAMGKQTGPDGQPINIPLAYLIVPRALRGTAQVVQKSEFEVGSANKNNTTPNIVRDTFQVIADARLDKVSSSVWYGSADPQMFDTIEVSYLDGQQEPYMEQKQGWDVDGTEFKVRIDAGVTALDWRGLGKNPGA